MFKKNKEDGYVKFCKDSFEVKNLTKAELMSAITTGLTFLKRKGTLEKDEIELIAKLANASLEESMEILNESLEKIIDKIKDMEEK